MSDIKLLVVDDNQEFAEVLANYFSHQEGIGETKAITDGAEAIRVIREFQPDCVILDTMLPHIDGLGVLETVCNDAFVPRFIMITAFDQPMISKRAKQLGVDYYVLKPFDIKTLLMRVRMVMGLAPDYLINAEMTHLIYRMGIPTNKGALYLRDAVSIAYHDPTSLCGVVKGLYTTIAAKYNTTPSGVERALRYAVDLAWAKGNEERIANFLKVDVEKVKQGRPTVTQFIEMVLHSLYDSQ